MSSRDPRQNGNAGDRLTAEESKRLDRYRARVGIRTALRELGTGEHTFYAARDGGRLQAKTRARLLERLATIEAADAEEKESA